MAAAGGGDQEEDGQTITGDVALSGIATDEFFLDSNMHNLACEDTANIEEIW